MEEEEAELSSVFVDSQHVACGLAHTLTVDAEGSVWGLGSNQYGQLGAKGKDKGGIPQRLELDVFVASVECGYFHSACIDTQSRLWTFGRNENGQLGVGDCLNRFEPTLVDNLPVASVSCGAYHTVCIDNSGDVWSFGYNEKGQLGLGDTRDRNLPSKIASLHNILSVASGYVHTVFLTNSKLCFRAGAKLDRSGQVKKKVKKPELIKDIKNIEAIASGAYLILILTEDKELYTIGYKEVNQFQANPPGLYSTPTKLQWNEGETFPIAISCGYYHGAIIDSSGCLWTFGSKSQFRTGTNTTALTMVEEVGSISYSSSGGNHSMIKNSEDEIWVWGSSDKRQLGEQRGFPTPERFNNQYDSIIGRAKSKAKSARK